MTSGPANPTEDRPDKRPNRHPVHSRPGRGFRTFGAIAAGCGMIAAVMGATGWANAAEYDGHASRAARRAQDSIESKGVDLLDTEGVRVFEDDPLVLGESIVLGLGSKTGVLLDVDLGESTSPRYRVSIKLEYTRRSLDFDPLIYVTDGRDSVGARFMEVRGGAASLIVSRQAQAELRPTIRQAISMLTDAQLPPVGERGRVAVTVDMNDSNARVRTVMGEAEGSASSEAEVDGSVGVSVQIARGLNSLQGLQIDSMKASLRPLPCGPADLAEPYGEFNIDDTRVFMERFNALEDSADLTGEGAVNLFDVIRFAELHALGCDG